MCPGDLVKYGAITVELTYLSQVERFCSRIFLVKQVYIIHILPTAIAGSTVMCYQRLLHVFLSSYVFLSSSCYT